MNELINKAYFTKTLYCISSTHWRNISIGSQIVAKRILCCMTLDKCCHYNYYYYYYYRYNDDDDDDNNDF